MLMSGLVCGVVLTGRLPVSGLVSLLGLWMGLLLLVRG